MAKISLIASSFLAWNKNARRQLEQAHSKEQQAATVAHVLRVQKGNGNSQTSRHKPDSRREREQAHKRERESVERGRCTHMKQNFSLSLSIGVALGARLGLVLYSWRPLPPSTYLLSTPFLRVSGKEIALDQPKHKTKNPPSHHQSLKQPMRLDYSPFPLCLLPLPSSLCPSVNLTSISALVFHRFFFCFVGLPEKFLAQLYAYGNEF